MIVELDTRLVEAFGGEALVLALQAIGAKTVVKRLPHARTATWRRIVTKTFDPQLNAFVPTDRTYLNDEPFVLCGMRAETLADLVARNAIVSEVRTLKQAFPQRQVLVLVDGLDEYFRKIKLEIKRSFQKQVREDGTSVAPAATTSSSSSSAKPDSRAIDQAILQINCTLGCNVMTVMRGETFADWMVTYTREVAVRPYEKLQMNVNTRVTIDDLGPSGKNLRDTWARMLQILSGFTPPVAEAVLQTYPTVQSLLQAYAANPAQAPRLLEDLVVNRQGYNASGLLRRLGASMSQRIYQNFHGTDPKLPFK
jgi:hypothetical protein